MPARSCRSGGLPGSAATGFQTGGSTPTHTARAVLSSGALGEVVRYEARYERWRPVPKERWREQSTSEEGGGVLMDLQPHVVDGALDLFGPSASVYAELAALTTIGDDVTFLDVHHVSGVVSHLGPPRSPERRGRDRLLGREATYLVADVDGDPTAYSAWLDKDDDHRGWVVRGEDTSRCRRRRRAGRLLHRGPRRAAHRRGPAGARRGGGGRHRGARRRAAIGPRERRRYAAGRCRVVTSGG